jgi:predicted solute-binding protein
MLLVFTSEKHVREMTYIDFKKKFEKKFTLILNLIRHYYRNISFDLSVQIGNLDHIFRIMS